MAQVNQKEVARVFFLSHCTTRDIDKFAKCTISTYKTCDPPDQYISETVFPHRIQKVHPKDRNLGASDQNPTKVPRSTVLAHCLQDIYIKRFSATKRFHFEEKSA